MTDVFLVSEADHEVGLGHLAELRSVASALRERGVAVMRINLGPQIANERDVEWIDDYRLLAKRLAESRPRIIGWSVRTNRWRSAWTAIERSGARHLWIADVADEYPAVDALVVPTLQPRRSDVQSKMRVYRGPQYFPLDRRGPLDVPPIRGRGRDVLLTLGGADRTEASLRIVPALAATLSTVVIGPAFRHRDALARIAASSGLDIVNAPEGLRTLLLRHRVVISAGGNTLFEAAAAGTPALVAWEDPHEEVQGKAFVEKGSARLLGRGAALDVAVAREGIARLLSSPTDLDAMSAAGRQLVDGRGADRIADLVLELAAGAAA